MPTSKPTRSTPPPNTPHHADEELKAERIQGEAPAPTTEPLKAERIQAFVRDFPAWRVRGANLALIRRYTFPGRASAVAYLNWIAAFTQEYGWPASAVWDANAVTVTLSTPGAGGVTESDLDLARELERAR